MERLLELIGDFGAYQKRKLALLSIQFFMSGVFLYAVVFVLAEPPHRCKVSEDDNYDIKDAAHNASVRTSIPVDGTGALSSCTYYAGNSTVSVESCQSFVYDTSEVGRTLTGEFDLVCNKRQIAAAIMTTGFIGRCIGSLLIGVMADKFGRKRTLVVSVAIQLISCSASIAPNPYSYLIFRLLGGCFSVGAYDCGYVLMMEMVGPKKRTLINSLASIVFTLGYIGVSAMAYLLRDWQHLNIFVAAPLAGLMFMVIWSVQESPRWHLTIKNSAAARSILEDMATVNGTTFPVQEYEQLSQQTLSEPSETDFKALVKNRAMLRRLLLLVLLWVSVDLAFYGISLQAQYLFGGVYVNNLLSAGVELPGSLMVYGSLYIGRKRANVISSLIGTAGLLSAGFLQFFSHGSDTGYGVVASTMIGKAGTAAAYNVLYVWTVEVVPTAYRNLVLGICSSVSGLATTIAPFIVQIGADTAGSSEAISSILFATVLGLCCAGALWLPETCKTDLPEDLQGAETIGSRKESSTAVANTYLELMHKAAGESLS